MQTVNIDGDGTLTTSVDGGETLEVAVDGAIESAELEIDGECVLADTIDGDPAEPTEMVNGEAGIFTAVSPNVYRGEYTVTPKTSAQTLETKNLMMTNDVTVRKIPYYEVGNPAGGETLYIASEV